MAEVDWRRAKEIFADLLDAPEGDRAARLAAAVGDDAALADVVRRLLSAHASATEFLDEASAPVRPRPRADDAAPSRIGPYELHEVLGEGGFGIVFRATQQEPVRREVALKLLKRGMDTQRIVRRFAAERDLLARMEHPCIAKVLDAGATPDGRPFVVMELVRGEPITAWCAGRRLDVRRRVELMAKVARTVHHAHQRAVIHRDLKPSNILVTETSGAAEPRIIDFGIAKATSGSAREDHTRSGEPIGTPRYMSPEQLAGEDGGDIRTDVYALGVVLCETLTGAVPRDPATMSGRVPREAPAERPSRLVLRARTGDADDAAPMRLDRALRGDLDRIVLKCVAWSPEDRYDSAAALADDLERHLRGEPVLAAGPGVLYRAGKFLRRHALAAALVAVAALSLLVGSGAAFVGLRSAQRERAAADAARIDAEQAAARAELVASYLLEDMLLASDPDLAQATGTPVSLARLLHEAEAHVGELTVQDPAATFAILGRIGAGLVRLRQAAEALAPLERAIALGETLGPEAAAEVLDLRLTLAEARRTVEGRGPAIEAERVRVRDEAIRTLGAAHPVTQRARLDAVADGRDLGAALAETDALLAEGVRDPLLRYHVLRRRAALLQALRRADDAVAAREAEAAQAEAVFGPEHSQRLSSIYQLAMSLAQAGRTDEAIARLEALLAMPSGAIPATHPGRLGALSLAVHLMKDGAGRVRARTLALDAERAVRRAAGAGSFDHALTAQLVSHVAPPAISEADAVAITVEAERVRSAILGGQQPRAGRLLVQLATMLRALERPEDARAVATAAVVAAGDDAALRRDAEALRDALAEAPPAGASRDAPAGGEDDPGG